MICFDTKHRRERSEISAKNTKESETIESLISPVLVSFPIIHCRSHPDHNERRSSTVLIMNNLEYLKWISAILLSDNVKFQIYCFLSLDSMRIRTWWHLSTWSRTALQFSILKSSGVEVENETREGWRFKLELLSWTCHDKNRTFHWSHRTDNLLQHQIKHAT